MFLHLDYDFIASIVSNPRIPYTIKRSYVIQHFDNHLRQCVIDLMLGQLRDGSQLHQDQPFDTVLAVCRSFVEPLLPVVPKPNRQAYSLSVFRNELWLTEQLVQFTRFAKQSLARDECAMT